MSDEDYMEIGETSLIPTEYGFINAETGERLDHDGLPLREDDDDSSKET